MPRKTRCTSTPASTSSAASRSAFGVVFVYWKRPVSVTTATYSASAIAAVRPTPSSRSRSRTISPVEEASATTTLTSPKRVLSWWWSTSIDRGTSPSSPAAALMREAFAQSSARRTRSRASAGSSRRSSPSGRKSYSAGRSVAPPRYMTASLPSTSRASFMPRREPRASPSGFSCVTSRKRSCERIASATAASSVVVDACIVLPSEVIDQLRQPHPPLDGGIVFEGELRGPLELQLARHPCLQHAVGGGEPPQRARARLLAAEDTDEDGRVAEVCRGGDA